MVTGKRRHGAGWRYLLKAASSADDDTRRVALIRGYAWVEHALDAAEAPGPRRPIARRILNTFQDITLSRGLNEGVVRTAIGIRNCVGHDDAVPAAPACLEAVEIFRDIWHALSRHFVNVSTATVLGRDILDREGILAVCIFGSLARGVSEPNDIDFLVIDDGTYSSAIDIGLYEEGTFRPAKATMKALDLLLVLSPKLKRCAECRWLDLMIVNGNWFGSDAEYTSTVRAAQPDPWFFVNISRDLKELDPRSKTFRPIERFPFKDLRLSQVDMVKLGFV